MKGLKTGMYYLRSRAAADAIKFTVDSSMLKVHIELFLQISRVPFFFKFMYLYVHGVYAEW